jgi:hypothetical protein
MGQASTAGMFLKLQMRHLHSQSAVFRRDLTVKTLHNQDSDDPIFKLLILGHIPYVGHGLDVSMVQPVLTNQLAVGLHKLSEMWLECFLLPQI